MRQSEDPQFAFILDRIRVGVPTNDDIDLLSVQLIKCDFVFDKLEFAAVKYLDARNMNHDPLCIMPLVTSANNLNTVIINKLKIQVITISSIDSNKANFKKSKKDKSHKELNNDTQNNIFEKLKRNQTAGLDTNLCIGIQAKVMLTRNLDTSIGLVNGAIGYITNIEVNIHRSTDIQKIGVKFQNINHIIQMERFVADFQPSKETYNTRAQFPITLAWAVTVHKSQGLSLDHTILDIGPDIFEGGMAYVALSRGRILRNVHLIELDPNSLYCCQEAYLEYQRLYRVSKLTSQLPLFINTRIVSKNLKNKKNSKTNNTKDKGDAVYKSNFKKNLDETNSKVINDDFLHLTCSINVINFKTYPLQFNNKNGTNCFSNVIMQLLLHLHPIFLTELNNLQINLTPSQIQFKQFFNKFYSYHFNDKCTYDTSLLKTLIADIYRHSNLPDYQNDQQEDSFLFLIHVLMALPPIIQSLFSFNMIIDVECLTCQTKNTFVQANETHLTINYTNNETYSDLSQALQLKSNSERFCNKCKSTKPHKDQSTLLFGDKHNYLLVYVHSFTFGNNNAQKINSRLHGLGLENFNIPNSDNYKFKLKTIVIRTGAIAENGHFKVWTTNLQTKKWLYINDTVIRTYKNIFKSLDNIFFLLFEKI